MTVRQLYFVIVQTTWIFQCNKHVFIECHYVFAVLINKSILDSKIVFFTLQELFNKRFYLFILREKGKEKERKRNVNVQEIRL